MKLAGENSETSTAPVDDTGDENKQKAPQQVEASNKLAMETMESERLERENQDAEQDRLNKEREE